MVINIIIHLMVAKSVCKLKSHFIQYKITLQAICIATFSEDKI